MTNSELISRLKELDKEATPAPWEAVLRWVNNKGDGDLSAMKKDNSAWADTKEDWELIVSLRNELPRILSLLQAGEELAEAAEAADKLKHSSECNGRWDSVMKSHEPNLGECDCGLDETLRALTSYRSIQEKGGVS